jgi:hypothetical protein
MSTDPVLDSLDDFLPAPKPAVASGHAQVQAVAVAHGFKERDAAAFIPRKRHRPVDTPMTSFTARVAVADANFFVEYAIEKRISYREAFSEMVELLRQAQQRA